MQVSFGGIWIDTCHGRRHNRRDVYVRITVDEALDPRSVDMTIGQAKRVHAWLGRVIAQAEGAKG